MTRAGTTTEPPEEVSHPSHYRAGTPYETIKVIEAWGLGFHLGNVVKYISRAGLKNVNSQITDLEKAAWYLGREIARAKMVKTLTEVKR